MNCLSDCSVAEVSFLTADAAAMAEFSSLYTQRIDKRDQVDPRFMFQWFGRYGRSPATAEELRAAVEAGEHYSFQLLLCARVDSQLAGVATVVYVRQAGIAFIAYIAADEKVDRGGAVIRSLLAYLDDLGCTMQPPWRWLVFELAAGSGDRTAMARARLFERYARKYFGRRLSRIDINYKIPSLEGRTPDPIADARGELILVSSTRGADSPSFLTRQETAEILSTIYLGIYAETLDDEQGNYSSLVRHQLSDVLTCLPETVRLL